MAGACARHSGAAAVALAASLARGSAGQGLLQLRAEDFVTSFADGRTVAAVVEALAPVEARGLLDAVRRVLDPVDRLQVALTAVRPRQLPPWLPSQLPSLLPLLPPLLPLSLPPSLPPSLLPPPSMPAPPDSPAALQACRVSPFVRDIAAPSLLAGHDAPTAAAVVAHLFCVQPGMRSDGMLVPVEHSVAALTRKWALARQALGRAQQALGTEAAGAEAAEEAARVLRVAAASATSFTRTCAGALRVLLTADRRVSAAHELYCALRRRAEEMQWALLAHKLLRRTPRLRDVRAEALTCAFESAAPLALVARMHDLLEQAGALHASARDAGADVREVASVLRAYAPQLHAIMLHYAALPGAQVASVAPELSAAQWSAFVADIRVKDSKLAASAYADIFQRHARPPLVRLCHMRPPRRARPHTSCRDRAERCPSMVLRRAPPRVCRGATLPRRRCRCRWLTVAAATAACAQPLSTHLCVSAAGDGGAQVHLSSPCARGRQQRASSALPDAAARAARATASLPERCAALPAAAAAGRGARRCASRVPARHCAPLPVPCHALTR